LQFEKFPPISLQEKSRLQNPITKGVARPTRVTIYLNKSVDRLLLDFGTLHRKKHNEEHPHTTMRYLKTCGKIRKQRKTVGKNKDTKNRLQLKMNCKKKLGGAVVYRPT
jgi:hypothetical protein